jgi:hypothetical protein
MENKIKENDQLRKNYQEMDETGKEKLREVSEKILDIWNMVNEKNEKKTEITLKMSEEMINMWSILISVLKNQGKEYGAVNIITQDISDIKKMIQFLK